MDLQKLADFLGIESNQLNYYGTLKYQKTKNNCKFMQITSDIQPYIDKYQIKGSPEQNTVICSDSKTYLVKQAETTNCYCLFEEKGPGNLICQHTTNTFYEVSLVTPNIYNHLSQLLANYTLKDTDDYRAFQPISWDNVCESIQASTLEIKELLTKMGAFFVQNLNDKTYQVFMIESTYYKQMVNHIISFIEENSWDIANGQISKAETMTALSDLFQKEVLELVFEKFTQPFDFSSNTDSYTLKPDLVARFYAEDILTNTKKPYMPFNYFMEVWKRALPFEIQPQHSYLQDMSIIVSANQNPTNNNYNNDSHKKQDYHHKYILYVREYTLPTEAKERIDAIFKHVLDADIPGLPNDFGLSFDVLSPFLLALIKGESVNRDLGEDETTCYSIQNGQITQLLNRYARKKVETLIDKQKVDEGLGDTGGPYYCHKNY